MDADEKTVSLRDIEKKISERIAPLERTISELSKAVNYLLKAAEKQRPPTQKMKTIPAVPVPPAPAVVEKPKEIFYFSNPLENTFIVSKTLPTIDGSLYRLERVVGEGKASVYVEDRPNVVSRFTAKPEAQDGVCDDEGNFNQSAQNIETLVPGVAVFEGDKWRVTQKVKIKYI